jgi:hypothetical protein
MDEPAPNKLLKWELAARFNWTLEYIGRLSMQDIQDYYQVRDGMGKAGVSWSKH